jgi:hypothetical protein
MNATILTMSRCDTTPSTMKAALLMMLLAVPGCISVKAPDKPIEINLNISVKQEVVVSLKKDAEDLITSNPELFPK